MGQKCHYFILISRLLQNIVFLIVRNFILIYLISVNKNLHQQDAADSYYIQSILLLRHSMFLPCLIKDIKWMLNVFSPVGATFP